MFYLLSKLLAYFITPAGMLSLLLLWLYRFRKDARPWTAWVIVFWMVAGSEGLSNELFRWWEPDPVTLPTSARPRVAVVLTGGIMQTELPPYDHPILGESSDRLMQALLLYRAGQVQKILISGGADPLDGRPTGNEGKLSVQFLEKVGVRPADVVLENASRNTEENARFTAPLLKRLFPDYEYVLVTSAFHMPRAQACFRKKGVETVVFPAAFVKGQRHSVPDWLLPSEAGIWRNSKLLHEWIGYAVYAAMGYL